MVSSLFALSYLLAYDDAPCLIPEVGTPIRVLNLSRAKNASSGLGEEVLGMNLCDESRQMSFLVHMVAIFYIYLSYVPSRSTYTITSCIPPPYIS